MGMYELKAEVRDVKSKPSQVRRDGYVPAVVYGAITPATMLKVPKRDIAGLFGAGASSRGLIELEIEGMEGEKKAVVVKEIQRDPIRGDVLHVDFHHISLDEKFKTEVPIVLVGDEVITAKGLIVQHQMRVVEVECLPTNIPDSFVSDISHLEPGQQLRIEDLSVTEGVRFLSEPGEVIVSVLAPKLVEEEVEEEGEGEVEGEGTEQEGAEEQAESE